MNCYSNNYNKYKYGNYVYQNSRFDVFMNEVPVSSEYGFIELQVTKDLGREIAAGSVLTIYVNRNGDQIPVVKLDITQNPTLIRLPIAHPSGTLIRGAEYYFTPYNLTIENEGYYNIATHNIRLFPNITAMFFYNFNRIIPGELNHEEITVIPPHPRDQT